MPENQVYVVHDLVRGQVTFDSDNIGDFIIMKSDGIPTYNFAVVIDDALMGITHVIRAEEHLANTPRQLMIYEALRFKRPEFAHISLILGEDRQKMSKRHGSTSLMEYRELGYLPEALFNFLALLELVSEGEEEILEKQQIVGSFTLERVSRSPAVFDLEKLNWMNQQYLKNWIPKSWIKDCSLSLAQPLILNGSRIVVRAEELADGSSPGAHGMLKGHRTFIAPLFAEPSMKKKPNKFYVSGSKRGIADP